MTGVVQLPSLRATGAESNFMGASLIPTSSFASKIKDERTSNGTHILRGIRVFKKGTFKDSMGMERTWEDVHLEQMAFHYKLLRDGGYLPNVPVRVDHSFSVQNVGGYFLDVYRDKDDDTFLAADVEITEPDVYDKWKRGTYRSRSLEVGMYETNDGAMYWPVIIGLAFVDLPAVEGLHAAGGRQSSYFTQALQDDNKENDMSGENGGQGGGTDQGGSGGTTDAGGAGGTTDQGTQGGTGGGGTTDQGGTTGAGGSTDVGSGGGANTGQPATEESGQNGGGDTGGQQQQADHGAHRPVMFTVNGRQTADMQAIQQHIFTLEQFRSETTKANRHRFVDELAKTNKIGANQIEDFKSHVETLTDEGFASFSKMYEAAPTHPLLGQYGHTPPGGEGNGNGNTGGNDLQQQFEIARDTVDQLKRSGMPDEQVEKTSAYKRLTTLQAQLSGQTA